MVVVVLLLVMEGVKARSCHHYISLAQTSLVDIKKRFIFLTILNSFYSLLTTRAKGGDCDGFKQSILQTPPSPK